MHHLETVVQTRMTKAVLKSLVGYYNYPFGLQMPERTFSSPEYRYGFNGKEKDEEEEWGDLTHYDYGARVFNPGIGRWFKTDNVFKPERTPYNFSRNNPLAFIDPDGNDDFYFNEQGILIGHVINDKPNRFFVERITRFKSHENHSGMDNFLSRYHYTPAEGFMVEIDPTYTRIPIWGLFNIESPNSNIKELITGEEGGSNLTAIARANPFIYKLLERTDPELGELLHEERDRLQLQTLVDQGTQAIGTLITVIETGGALMSLNRSFLKGMGRGGITIRSGASGADVRNATFVRQVQKGEKIEDLVTEAKLITRGDNVEAAVIQLDDGTRHIVTGGKHGINLPANTTKLYGHTHPNLSGGGFNYPSQGDREALMKLDQSRTYIFHDGQRTTIYKGKDARWDTSTTNY